MSHTLQVELHDCDEFVQEGNEQTFGFGVAKFTLKDILYPYCNNLKLRGDVFPVKRAMEDTMGNLDLNATARKAEKIVEKSSPYLVNGTYFLVTVDLARNIGEFDEKEELKRLEDERKAAIEAEEGKKSPEPESQHEEKQEEENPFDETEIVND